MLGLILVTVDNHSEQNKVPPHSVLTPTTSWTDTRKFTIRQVVVEPLSKGVQLKSKIGMTTFSILKEVREQTM